MEPIIPREPANAFDRFGDDEEPAAQVGALLHSMLTGEPRNISREQFMNAIGSNDSAGGYILNGSLSGQIVDLARSASVALRAGENEGTMMIGDFSQVVIGMRTSGAVVRILDAGTVTDGDGTTHNAASELKKLIVAYVRTDVAVLRPSWLTVLSGITV